MWSKTPTRQAYWIKCAQTFLRKFEFAHGKSLRRLNSALFLFHGKRDPNLLGHKQVRTTMIYTHVLNRAGKAVRSPLDVLLAGSPDF